MRRRSARLKNPIGKVHEERAFTVQDKVELVKQDNTSQSETNEDQEYLQDDEQTSGLSEVESVRRRNLDRNVQFLKTLGIREAARRLVPHSSTKKPSARGLKRPLKSTEPIPRRPPSMRLQKKDPDGAASILPAPSYFPFVTDEKERKSGPLSFADALTSHDDPTVADAFIKSLKAFAKFKIQPSKRRETSELIIRTRSMSLAREGVAKVVHSRVCSLVVHPSEERLLVAAGGKWGGIGLWDVESSNSLDGAYLFEPHVRPIYCLKFPPQDGRHLYSASYDGSVRCGDLVRGVFDEVYSSDDDDRCTYLDFTSNSELLVSQSCGHVVVVDTRTPGVLQHKYKIHDRLVKSISVHPLQKYYFLSSAQDGNVFLWDLRQMHPAKSHHVQSLPHPKSVDSAYFSPNTGQRIVTTCLDDRIRLYNSRELSENITTKYTLSHNNYTGRWLTNFRATWLPQSDDLFVVGSMHRPRQIELYSAETGSVVRTFQDEDNLNSVCSCNAFHPTLNILVGANSSGRLHVLK